MLMRSAICILYCNEYITVNLLCNKNLQNSRIVNCMLTLQIFVFKIIVVGLIRLNHKRIRQIKWIYLFLSD